MLLTATAPVGNYWVSAQPQFRMGSPSGFAILRYEGANQTILPVGLPPQPGSVKPWTPDQAARVKRCQRIHEKLPQCLPTPTPSRFMVYYLPQSLQKQLTSMICCVVFALCSVNYQFWGMLGLDPGPPNPQTRCCQQARQAPKQTALP